MGGVEGARGGGGMEGGFDPLVMLKKSIDGAVLGEVFFLLFLLLGQV
jgi:hypothetical protein